jgi:hypothetical protein
MTDNGQVVWEDPPDRPNAPGKWVRALLPLTDHPGRWARIHDATTARTARHIASRLRLQTLQVPPGRWEFDHHKGRVYARYLGPEDGGA